MARTDRASRGGLLRRLSQEGWGVRNLEGIGDPNDHDNRVRVIRLAATVGTSLGGIAVVSFLVNLVTGVSIEQYEPLQVILIPMAAREIDPGFGALHGINALVLFVIAAMAGRRVGTTSTAKRRADDVPVTA